MANESRSGKVLFLTVFLLVLFQPALLEAAPNFSSLRSSGLLTDQSFMNTIPEEKSAEKTSFFGTLEPGLSSKGRVKTYTVKYVQRSDSSAGEWSAVSSRRSSKNNEVADISGIALARPVTGRLSSLFGNRQHPSSKSSRFHAGIDISAPRGTPVNSSMSGKVTYAGWRRGYGLVVVIDHGKGIETVYAHCSKLAVKVGQHVNTGQRIGYVGNTGVATGSHLHFEVRRDGNVRNPLRYMNF